MGGAHLKKEYKRVSETKHGRERLEEADSKFQIPTHPSATSSLCNALRGYGVLQLTKYFQIQIMFAL